MTAGSKQDRRECHSQWPQNVIRVACDYAMRATDPACTGCLWRSAFERTKASGVIGGNHAE